MKTRACGVVLLALLVTVCQGATIYVNGETGDDVWDGLCETWDGGTCGPKATIQAGIDAASNGDEVVVADGIYTGAGNKNLDFNGKAIAVRSASGDPALCIIDCEGDGRGFYLDSDEGPDSIVEGLTITNGSAAYNGGGVYCLVGSSPTLTNCTISGNSAGYGSGGGVYCEDHSSPTLTGCTISGNSAGTGDGGAVCCIWSSSPTLTNCTISGNSAGFGGGGVDCSSGSPTLTNCTISGNSAGHGGGGVYCSASSPTLTGCTISGNSAGIGDGGGVYCSASSPALTNCTISGNSAEIGGGGVYCSVGSSPTLTNCILWGDTPEEIYVNAGSPVVTYCDVQGGWAGTGNIDADPLFVDDYHLAAGSPCIDAADNTAVPPDVADLDEDGDTSERTPLDLAGDPRFVDDPGTADTGVSDPPDYPEIVDMGAYEYQVEGETIYVDDDAPNDPGPGDPTVSDPDEDGSPEHPFDAIQEGIDAANDGDEVIVLDGTYTGPGNKNLDFGGKAITVRSENGPDNCIIDSENDGRGFYFHTGETATSVVDGFTITNGHPSDEIGGGVYCEGSSPTITNCTITENSAWYSGGVYCSESSPTIVNCTITGNTTDWAGGGVHCSYSHPTITNCTITGNTGDGGGVHCSCSDPTITNCTITGNTGESGGVHCSYSDPTITNCTISENSGWYGGAVYCDDYSSPTITNCTMMGNTAYYGGGVECLTYSDLTITNCTITGNTASYGGGILCYWYSNPAITNCTITGNTAGWCGGAVYCELSNPTITNCTITGNTVNWGGGGGVYCYWYSNPTITNCILWGDTPQEIYVVESGGPVVTYCDVQGGWPGTGNIDADPLFVDPDGPDDDPETWEDNDYHLAAGSPCIDAGDPDFVPALGETDIDDELRVWDGDGDGVAIVDMGSDEYGSAAYGDLNCDGILDFFDLDPFVMAMTFPDEYPAAYPDCDIMLADCHHDGLVDFFDIDAFVVLLVD